MLMLMLADAIIPFSSGYEMAQNLELMKVTKILSSFFCF